MDGVLELEMARGWIDSICAGSWGPEQVLGRRWETLNVEAVRDRVKNPGVGMCGVRWYEGF